VAVCDARRERETARRLRYREMFPSQLVTHCEPSNIVQPIILALLTDIIVNATLKLSLCLIKIQRQEEVYGTAGIVPGIRNFCTKWEWLASCLVQY
jgi:hypothetical protein